MNCISRLTITIFLVLSACTTVLAQQIKLESKNAILSFDTGPGWNISKPLQSGGHIIRQLTREDEDVKEGRERITILIYPLFLGSGSPEKEMNDEIRVLAEKCPSAFKWNTIAKDENSILYEMHRLKPCKDMERLAHGITKIIYGDYKIFGINYRAFDIKQMPSAQREGWAQKLSKAKVTPTVKKGSATEVYEAVEQNDIARIKELLAEGADVNKQQPETRHSALHIAIIKRSMKIAQLLVEEGANVNARNKTKSTPLHVAAMYGHDDIVMYLLSKGANVEAKESRGQTPLMIACTYKPSSGRESVIDILLQAGANINEREYRGYTALLIAIMRDHTEIAKLLIESGADVHAKTDEDNVSTLHFAAYLGNTEIVELLLKHGIDINARTSRGNTALSAAQKQKHKEVVQLLKQHGAETARPTSPSPFSSWEEDW